MGVENRNRKRFFIAFFCCLVSLSALAKDVQVIEDELVECVKRINYWKTRPADMDENFRILDSLYIENIRLKGLLLDYSVSVPTTLTYAFDSLRAYINIASSDDQKLRIYSWWLGEMDDMEYFFNVFQYEAGGKVYSTLINYDDGYDPKGYYSKIHSVAIGQDTTVYMGYFHAFYSPKDFSDSFQTFCIEGTQLHDSIPIFQTGDSLLSSLEVLYHPLSHKNYKKELILYQAKEKQIKLRDTDQDGMVLRRHKKFVFNGKLFKEQID